MDGPLLILAAEDGREVTVTTSAATVITVQIGSSIEDLALGEQVRVIGTPATAGTITASTIAEGTGNPPPPPPPSPGSTGPPPTGEPPPTNPPPASSTSTTTGPPSTTTTSTTTEPTTEATTSAVSSLLDTAATDADTAVSNWWR